MTIIDVLKAARSLIAKPKWWSKGGCRARNRTPIIEECEDVQRHARCAGCAIFTASKRDYDLTAKASTLVAGEDCTNDSGALIAFNDADEITHAMMMGAFDRAIAAEQAKEPA